MSHNLRLKEGAFVISDAHYSRLRPELLGLIKDIHSKKLQPPQLILMGDIFDALFGGIPYACEENKEAIALLNDISKNIETVYLEGNHDFNLRKLFPFARVIPIANQPVLCEYQNKSVYLAHGDFDGARGYKIYTSLIRNPFVLFALRWIDAISNNYILKKLDEYLGKKDDCAKFSGFKTFIENRLGNKYECDYFIEGHFHQNATLEFENFKYVNLGAFACNQRYFIVKSSQNKELLEENIFSKGI
jgi:UDP-2,3-diacylglucosamine hydrolase